jgi:lysozyme family protein
LAIAMGSEFSELTDPRLHVRNGDSLPNQTAIWPQRRPATTIGRSTNESAAHSTDSRGGSACADGGCAV